MAIVFTNLGNSTPAAPDAPDMKDNTDTTSYANASWTPPSADNSIILLCVYNSRSATLGSEPTVTGNNLTWTLVVTAGIDAGAVTHRASIYAAISTGTATAGATTASFGADTQSGCEMAFCQVTDVDLTGGIAGAFVQSPTNTGASNASGTVTMSAFANDNNRPFATFYHNVGEGTTRQVGWTELDDITNNSPGVGVETQCKENGTDTFAIGSWNNASAAWVGIALEIKASVATYNESVSIARTNLLSIVAEWIGVISKGFVSVSNFNASATSPSDFKASIASSTDQEASSTATSSFASSNASTSDISASGVETEDL